MWKNIMTIQYTAPGFEPTTFRTQVPPLNTRPGLPPVNIIYNATSTLTWIVLATRCWKLSILEHGLYATLRWSVVNGQPKAGTQFLFEFFFLKKMGQPWPLFRLFSVFSNKQYNFYNNNLWKMSIQYMVLGFEPTTFGTWVSSHNH